MRCCRCLIPLPYYEKEVVEGCIRCQEEGREPLEKAKMVVEIEVGCPCCARVFYRCPVCLRGMHIICWDCYEKSYKNTTKQVRESIEIWYIRVKLLHDVDKEKGLTAGRIFKVITRKNIVGFGVWDKVNHKTIRLEDCEIIDRGLNL